MVTRSQREGASEEAGSGRPGPLLVLLHDGQNSQQQLQDPSRVLVSLCDPLPEFPVFLLEYCV